MDADATAARILRARAEGTHLVADEVSVSPDDAYAVQRILTRHRLERGERIIGWKLGYTSDAMRAQMHIDRPNLGPLTDAMAVPDGGLLPPASQPKVEPEIGLVIDRPVTSPLDIDGCRSIVRTAHLALEIVDSVWRDYRFTWAHNTADGSSAAHFVLGTAIDPTDLATLTVGLEHNGSVVGTGVGAAAMGDPVRALAWLTEQLPAMDRTLLPGDIILTGGLCSAIDLALGDSVRATSHAGDVHVRR